MMELQLGTVSDHAYSDERGKLYILGEFRYVFAQEVPAIHNRLALTLRIVGDKVEGYEHQLKVDLTDADGRSILPGPIEGQLKFGDVGAAEVGKMRVQVVIELNRVKFDVWGDYAFQVFVDGQHKGAVPICVAKPPGQKKKKRSH